MSASRCRRRPAGGTRGTCGSCPPSHVLFAAGRPRTPIIFVSQSRALSAAKSATNSLCLSAALTTALFTRRATNAPGGTTPPLTRCPSPGTFGVSAVDQQRFSAPSSGPGEARPFTHTPSRSASRRSCLRGRKLPRKPLCRAPESSHIADAARCQTGSRPRSSYGRMGVAPTAAHAWLSETLSSTIALPWRCAMCVLMPITPNF